MKQKLLFFSMLFLFLSCINEENNLNSFDENIMTKVSATIDRIYIEPIDLIRKAEQGHIIYQGSMTEVHRYYYYPNRAHYWGTEGQSSTINAKDVTYNYEGNDFNIIKNTGMIGDSDLPLYRHYSSTKKSYRLSTASSISGYTQDELMGYIQSFPTANTRPLKEYYNATLDRYHYVILDREVEYLRINDPDFIFTGIIGYVWQGKRSESESDQPRAKFELSMSGPDDMSMILCLNVRAKYPDGTYKNTTFYYDSWTSTGFGPTIIVPEFCDLLSVDVQPIDLDRINLPYVYLNVFQNGFPSSFYLYNRFYMDLRKDGSYHYIHVRKN